MKVILEADISAKKRKKMNTQKTWDVHGGPLMDRFEKAVKKFARRYGLSRTAALTYMAAVLDDRLDLGIAREH